MHVWIGYVRNDTLTLCSSSFTRLHITILFRKKVQCGEMARVRVCATYNRTHCEIYENCSYKIQVYLCEQFIYTLPNEMWKRLLRRSPIRSFCYGSAEAQFELQTESWGQSIQLPAKCTHFILPKCYTCLQCHTISFVQINFYRCRSECTRCVCSCLVRVRACVCACLCHVQCI